jgi:hypothetical protein
LNIIITILLIFKTFDDRKIDLIVESDWKWWVIGKGVLTVPAAEALCRDVFWYGQSISNDLESKFSVQTLPLPCQSVTIVSRPVALGEGN